MAEPVKAAFESDLLTLPMDVILPLRQVSEASKMTAKYKRIATSVAEVGIIEPPVVARPKDGDHRYLLLDGHIRLAVLADRGTTTVRCLVADDDEAYTYNKRINRLATIQEHYMIVRALDRGVSAEKLARALNVNPQQIKRRRTLLEGVCPEVIDILKDKPVNPKSIEVLKKMKTGRQIEAAELMVAVANYSSSYAKALLAATKPHDLVKPDQPKKLDGLTPEQMARMEREMEALQEDFKSVEASYGDDVLQLVVATGYVSKLISNPEIRRYLSLNQPEVLSEFQTIVATSSLDQASVDHAPPALEGADDA